MLKIYHASESSLNYETLETQIKLNQVQITVHLGEYSRVTS